jgi:hypothetical protein
MSYGVLFIFSTGFLNEFFGDIGFLLKKIHMVD